MRVYAYIPARSGSKGVPHKNIREIAGHPLLAYSIAFAKKVRLDRIIVSANSQHYRDIALSYGAECPYLRGAAASNATAFDEEILADIERKPARHRNCDARHMGQAKTDMSFSKRKLG